MKLMYCLSFLGTLVFVPFMDTKVLRSSLVVSTESLLSGTNEKLAETSSKKEIGAQPQVYEMCVDANVSNRYVKTMITSKVNNLDSKGREAIFTVVIPDKAFISGFLMEIDGEKYEAYIQEKQEAKLTYDDAIFKGYSAGHVAVSARDSNRFTVSVNVQPQSKANFYFTYEELLTRKDKKYEVVLNVHPGQPVENFTVQVNIVESRPLKFVKVPGLRSGNKVSKEQNDTDFEDVVKTVNHTSAIVKFSPDMDRQKSLASDLGWNEKDGLSGQFVVQYDVERDPDGGEVLVDGGYFVHFFAPENLQPLNKQVVFVLDTSSSMNGKRIIQLKEAMDSILYELRPKDIFSIVTFNALVSVWNVSMSKPTYRSEEEICRSDEVSKVSEKELPGSFLATELNIENAKKVVENLEAYGGTDIYSALKVALEIVALNEDPKSHQPIIVFLTDGEPTIGIVSIEKIISKITEDNFRKAPIFALSLGSSADRGFLQQLALHNRGFSRHIYEGADAYIQLENFYQEISSPLLSNVTFKYTERVSDVTNSKFPLLFHGGELCVSGKVPDPEFGLPLVEACAGNGSVVFKPKVFEASGNLERLWAYMTLKQVLQHRKIAEDKTRPTQEALRFALKYSFVTDVSSLVVVQPKGAFTVNPEDASKSADEYFEDDFEFTYSADPLTHSGIHDYVVGASFLTSTASSRPVNSTSTLRHIPWLKDVTDSNGTFTFNSKSYSLGIGKTLTSKPECTATVNRGTGVCTLLDKCTEIHSVLTDFNIYRKYFCVLENFYAGVCCPSQIAPGPGI